LQAQYQQIFNSNPTARLNPSKLLESKYFSNPFVDTCVFLENIALKEAYEKTKFFKKLGSQLEKFPSDTCKYKILPQLVTALDFGGATSNVLEPLLKIAKDLNNEEYEQTISPSLVKWFSSPDRNLRMTLLQNLEQFSEHLTNNVVDNHIFASVASGFVDTVPALREISVKSMLLLVPKLTEKNIIEMLRSFSKLQMDEEPGIRTNTTICIAKMANYFSKDTRDKVLIPAFARSLKDPFPRTRIAGLMSLAATQIYYNKEDCATKVLPVISLLTIDPDKEVRDTAFKTINQFLENLKEISETGKDINPDEIDTKSNKSVGVLGWALGAVSKKIYGEGSSTPTTPQAKDIKANGNDKSQKNNNEELEEDEIETPDPTPKKTITKQQTPKPKESEKFSKKY